MVNGGGQGGGGGYSKKNMSMSFRRKSFDAGGSDPGSGRKTPHSCPPQTVINSERTVKRLRLTRALTMPDNSTVYEVCRKMAARKVDAALLTDSNTMLCGILTDQDIAKRIVASELKPTETPVYKVMTKNPVFVLSDTLAVEALQKMVQGRFRHLPVVENGEVIGLLNIAKCLYDAISRMESAAEKGKAIAAVVEGVEKQWGTSISGPHTFIETLRERIFSPSLATIVPELSKVANVSASDTVLVATRKMFEYQQSSVLVTVGKKAKGIITSKDVLMRVIAQNLHPNYTPVEKVMTTNLECATPETLIVNALQLMHDGKFLHLPILDKDGSIIAIADVIHITHAVVATLGNISGGAGNEATSSIMQKFWDSTMAWGPALDDEEELMSEGSMKLVSEGAADVGRSFTYPTSVLGHSFGFKLEDKKGRKHRFTCDTRNLTDLITAILQRVGDDIRQNQLPQILYEDEDHDKIVLASDNDLVAAVDHAKLAGWKGLRIYLDYSGSDVRKKNDVYGSIESAPSRCWASTTAFIACAALVAGVGVAVYRKRASFQ